MNERKKIFIVIPKYKIGGAERVMIGIANQLAKYNLKVFLITLVKTEKFLLSKNIKLINLDTKKVIYSILKLKEVIDKFKPDICLSTISHTNIALYFASKLTLHKSRIFLRESNNLFESLDNYNFFYKFIFLQLINTLYKSSNLMCQYLSLIFKLYIKRCFRFLNALKIVTGAFFKKCNLKGIKISFKGCLNDRRRSRNFSIL